MGYVVIELTCAGIPEEKLEAEPFTVDQENVLLQLDAGIQTKIRKGIPYAVVDLESRETICRFNQKNVKASDFYIRMLSRTIYESARKFYEDPEYVRAFEKWKAERTAEEKKEKED